MPPAVGLISENYDRFGPLFCCCMWQRHVRCYGHTGSLLASNPEKGSSCLYLSLNSPNNKSTTVFTYDIVLVAPIAQYYMGAIIPESVNIRLRYPFK